MARPREFDEDRVLDAVMETFWAKGYERTSAQDIVDATGLGRSSLYAAYSSKDGLFEQALLRYRQRSQATAESLKGTGAPIERLRRLMQNIVDGTLPGPAGHSGCLATNSAIEMASHDARIAELVRSNFAILSRGIEDTIREGQEAGTLRADRDAATLARFVFNAMQGLSVMTRAATPEGREQMRSTIDLTLEALR